MKRKVNMIWMASESRRAPEFHILNDLFERQIMLFHILNDLEAQSTLNALINL